MKMFVALCVLLAAPWAFAQARPEPAVPETDWSRALTYPLKDLRTGKPTTLAALKGKSKAIFIDNYASWCGDCRRAQPEVLRLHKELRGKGVTFVGLDVWDDWDKIKAHQAKNHLPYLILKDPDKSARTGITSLIGVTHIPTVIILDGRTLEDVGRFVDEKSVHLDEERATLRALGVSLKP